MTMTRGFVLISFRSNKGGENVPKQGHLIYSEPHMTFNTNWCEIFRNVTNSWLPLTNYHWFSLSSSSSSLFHLFPSSPPPPPPFFHTFSHRHWQSSSHCRLKRGSLFFYIMQLSLIRSGWIMHCVTNNGTENIFFFLNASSVFWFPQARMCFFLLAREYAFDKCNNLLPEMVWHDVGKRLKQIIQEFYSSSEFR